MPVNIHTWFIVGLGFLVSISWISFGVTRHFEKNLDVKERSWIASECAAPLLVTFVCLTLSDEHVGKDLGVANQLIGYVIFFGVFYLFILQITTCMKSWYRKKCA